ncbi:MAG: ribonuclease P protein component [bacterium]|nr:ribonuclease P protein component [bacterium]
MLAKKFRLTTEAFPLHARQKPSHVERSASFAVKAYPSTADCARVGVVIGKKVDARATARNRIKRQAYDMFGKALPNLPIADYMCIVQPGAQNKTKAELQAELSAILDTKY